MHKIGSLSLSQLADTVRLSFAILLTRKKEKNEKCGAGGVDYLFGRRLRSVDRSW